MAEWTIERLADRHVCLDFDCGKPPLSEWIKQHARSFGKRDLARVYVATRAGAARVCGYYAISNCQLGVQALPAGKARKGLPSRLSVPGALLGKLAVDRSAQGQKLGGFLLIDSLRRIQHLADEIGLRLVVVDAIDENARRFYLHHGFESLDDDANRLFMPVSIIRQLNLKPLSD